MYQQSTFSFATNRHHPNVEKCKDQEKVKNPLVNLMQVKGMCHISTLTLRRILGLLQPTCPTKGPPAFLKY